jgi:hypothetical protein
MEEGKDHYLGKASEAEIRDALVRHLELGFLGASVAERMSRGRRTEDRRGVTTHTSAISRAAPIYEPRPNLSPRRPLRALCHLKTSALCQSTTRVLRPVTIPYTPILVGPIATGDTTPSAYTYMAPPRRPLTQRRAPYHDVVRLHAEHLVYFQKMFGQGVIHKKCFSKGPNCKNFTIQNASVYS